MMEIKLVTEEYKMEGKEWSLKEKRTSILSEENYNLIADACYIDGKNAKVELNKYDDSNRLVEKILIDKKGMKKHVKTFIFPN